MSSADAVAGVLWIGVTAYAVFGGADFGAGFWSLVAGRGERGRRARELIDWAIGPVWEANHVWLIFVLVVLWTGVLGGVRVDLLDAVHPAQPGRARHRAARRGLRVPQDRARGSGAGSSPSACSGSRRCSRRSSWAPSSAPSPSGRVPVGNAAGDPVTSWLNPLSLRDRRAVRRDVRLPRGGVPGQRRAPRRRRRPRALLHRPRARRRGRRGRRSPSPGIVALHADARYVYDGLTERRAAARDRLGAVRRRACSCCCAAARARGARPLAVGAVVAVIWGWGVAQHPYLLPQVLTIDAGAAPSATLTAC